MVDQITPEDVMLHAAIKSKVKAVSVAQAINEYAANYNVSADEIIATLKQFKNLSPEELKVQNRIFEGQKTLLKQRLSKSIIDTEMLK